MASDSRSAAREDRDYLLDGVEYPITQERMTPAQIMVAAQPPIDPSNHYLTEILKDKTQISLEGKNDSPIEMKEDMVLVSAKTGPTAVS